MGYIDELESLGVNVAEGIDRVMGDQPYYEMLLGIFVDLVRENQISLEDFEAEDLEGLDGKAHTLKGMTGNLSFTQLYDDYVELLKRLRENKPGEARAVMERILPVQQRIVECIERNRAGEQG